MRPLVEHPVGELGRFEYRNAESSQNGIVVGVPRGGSEPSAIDFGGWISAANQAGLVIGYDFGSKRIPVSQPLVHQSPIAWTQNAKRRGAVYSEFTKLLKATVDGPIEFYVGVRMVDSRMGAERIEVAAAGFSFEELVALRDGYQQLRDDQLDDRPELPKVAMAIDPLDDISWQPHGVRNHGVLMLAQRGLILRLPKTLAANDAMSAYRHLLATWIRLALNIAQGRSGLDLPAFTSERSAYGRIDAIAARDKFRGIVVAAPHGSFDWHTGEMVEELSYRTRLPAVITRGFTPTECDGWRINVNRPSERRYPTDTVERKTQRAGKVYEQFSATVARLAGGPLSFYVDMHQNGEVDAIDVATVGISIEQASQIKALYQRLRDETLVQFPGVASVKFAIEPVDQVAIGAWDAKDHGILRRARSALHIELPSHLVLAQRQARRAYTLILSRLIQEIIRQGIVPGASTL